jgi:hypothetical protein
VLVALEWMLKIVAAAAAHPLLIENYLVSFWEWVYPLLG